MLVLRLFLAALLLPGLAVAQPHVSFPTQDRGVVYADPYGKGERAVVLAQGGRFAKESWKEQVPTFLNAGFRVLAIDFRGRGQSRGPQSKSGEHGAEYDVLAAVRYLHKTGAKTVSIVGASFGGEAAADASIEAGPGEIDRLVLPAAWTDRPAEKIKGRKLFIVARDDANDEGPRLPKIRSNYEKAADAKELIILDGSAHAQSLASSRRPRTSPDRSKGRCCSRFASDESVFLELQGAMSMRQVGNTLLDCTLQFSVNRCAVRFGE